MKMLAYQSLAAAIQGFASRGIRKILVTSSGPGEGKSTLVANVGRALAETGPLSVVLMDVDPFRPTLHKQFGTDNRRGLGDLLREVYQINVARENPDQFGLGDWVEILRAQSKTGRLRITQGGEEYSILFVRGQISSVFTTRRDEDGLLASVLVRQGRITGEQRLTALKVQQEGHKRIGDVLHGLGYVERGDLETALQAQLKLRLHHIVMLKGAHYEFGESAQPHVAAFAGRHSEQLEFPGIDRFITERLADYFKHPFLSSQVPGYLTDTPLQRLKLLTTGEAAYNMRSPAFAILTERLARTFDVVLMDSPPVAVTSPTNDLSTLVHGVLLVVQAEGYDVEIVQQAKQQLERTGAHLLGVVLNQVNVKQDKTLLYYYGAFKT